MDCTKRTGCQLLFSFRRRKRGFLHHHRKGSCHAKRPPCGSILVFNENNPYGIVEGARTNYDGSVDAEAKGLAELKDGDRLDFLCDYYGYDESFQNNYYLGEPLIVDGPLTISNVSIGNEPYRATYRLTDIYHNRHWTLAVTR